MINFEDFDSNLLKMDKKSYKNIGIKNICTKNIHSVNPLYLIIGELNGFIEEKTEINTYSFIQQIKIKKY